MSEDARIVGEMADEDDRRRETRDEHMARTWKVHGRRRGERSAPVTNSFDKHIGHHAYGATLVQHTSFLFTKQLRSCMYYSQPPVGSTRVCMTTDAQMSALPLVKGIAESAHAHPLFNYHDALRLTLEQTRPLPPCPHPNNRSPALCTGLQPVSGSSPYA